MLEGMQSKKTSHQELLAKIDKIGDSALAELRRRGVTEAKIKRILSRTKPKPKREANS